MARNTVGPVEWQHAVHQLGDDYVRLARRSEVEELEVVQEFEQLRSGSGVQVIMI